jgi:pimeloyl-ACP methyl ester carboxylesterase
MATQRWWAQRRTLSSRRRSGREHVSVDEQTVQVAGSQVFVRRAPAAERSGAGDPVLYLHSAPTSSDDGTELLAITGGLAPDLPGFGRSGKGGHLDLSLQGQATFVLALLDTLAIGRVALVGHGWGAAIGLIAAQRQPPRFSQIVVIDGVPLWTGAPLPPIADRLRRPLLGELLMGSMNRGLLARVLRGASEQASAWPDLAVDAAWAQFDQGTQRAILRLHRSGGPEALAAAGAQLGVLHGPALVIWGEQDPWLSPDHALGFSQRLGNARVERVAGAGHWPLRDRPEIAQLVARWLSDRDGS